MSIKLTRKQLKQIILEEVKNLKENPAMDRYDAAKMFSQELASKGIANKAERAPLGRSEMHQLFMGLLGELGQANEEEVKQLAKTVLNFVEEEVVKEGVENITPENLKLVYDVLVKMSPMLAGLAIGTPLMAALLNKIQGGGMDEELDNDMFEEEVENYLEESLYYGLIEEDDELLEKKKKKGCKPSKGKKYARRVKGKCVSYGAKGYKIAPGTSKGNSYCARSYGDMKSHGKDCSGKDRSTPLCLSRKKWKCSGKYSRKGK